ncbi:hypothetical protein KP509_11G055300 [Ceratopteris richardii]|nr:hypothetical protein KP509_11G055300 [Ceratopteris richardii]
MDEEIYRKMLVQEEKESKPLVKVQAEERKKHRNMAQEPQAPAHVVRHVQIKISAKEVEIQKAKEPTPLVKVQAEEHKKHRNMAQEPQAPAHVVRHVQIKISAKEVEIRKR